MQRSDSFKCPFEAASDFATVVDDGAREHNAPLGEGQFAAAGAFREALRACVTTYKVHYARLYQRVQREDAATIRAIRAFYRRPDTESPLPAVQAYLSRMERFLAGKHTDESVERELIALLNVLDLLAEPEYWSESAEARWPAYGKAAVKAYAAAIPAIEELDERLRAALAKRRVTLEDRQPFDLILLLFPTKGEIQPSIEGSEIRLQLSAAIAGLKGELNAYADAFLPSPDDAIREAAGIWRAQSTGICSRCGACRAVSRAKLCGTCRAVSREKLCLECAYKVLAEADHSCVVCGAGCMSAWPKSSASLWATSDTTTILVPCCDECMGDVLRVEVEAGRRPVVDVEIGSVLVAADAPTRWRGGKRTVRCVLEGVTDGGLLMARPKEATAARPTCIDPPKIQVVVGLEAVLAWEDEGALA